MIPDIITTLLEEVKYVVYSHDTSMGRQVSYKNILVMVCPLNQLGDAGDNQKQAILRRGRWLAPFVSFCSSPRIL